MDAIESLDWGAYAHFSNEASRYPAVAEFMQNAYYLSSYVAVSLLLLIAVTLFLVQKKRRSALVVLVSFLAAVVLIEAIRWLVPRRRPEDAQLFLGPEAMRGSYPSAGVFLFTLVLIFIAFALWSVLPRVWGRGAYVLIAALLVGWVCISQFFLAIHFVTDVIGGLAGAALVSWVAYKCLEPNAMDGEQQKA